MSNIMIIKTFFVINLITSLSDTVTSSRADLGTYLNVNDFSNGLPAAEERVTVDNYVLAYINYTYNTSDGKVVNFSEERAKYGEGKILNVQGVLVHVTSVMDKNDHTACDHRLAGTKGGPLPNGAPWIALIRRGKCTFEEKVKHAWIYRAVGVIVYNEENSVILDKMKIVEKERNITAVFTHKWIGEEMAKIVDSGHRVWVSISEGQRGMRSIPNINKTSVLFVSISFIVLMIISLIWLIFYYVQRFRYLQSKDKHSRHLCSVAKRIIAKIPTRSIKTDEKDVENDCCPVCIELYKPTDCIRVLPCRHEFHKTCIDPWLLEHRTCPMCKLDVLKHYGFVHTGSQESFMQLDLDVEIGRNGLRGEGENQSSNHNGGRLSISSSIFQLSPFNRGSHLIRSSSLVSLVPTQRETVPERSRSSMSCVINVMDGLTTSKPGQCFKGEENCISKTINSHIIKFGETGKSKDHNSLSRFKSTEGRDEAPNLHMLSENCSSCVEKVEKSFQKSKLLCTRSSSEEEIGQLEETDKKSCSEHINDEKK